MLSACCLFVLALTAVNVAEGAEWGYYNVDESKGPKGWTESYPECGKKRQSPIEIDVSATKFNSDLGEIKFTGYDKTTSNETFTMKNTGHNINVEVLDGTFQISEGGLSATYNLIGFHWHWAKESHEGSEHVIKGEKYGAELHLVHRKSTYSTTEEALKAGDGLAVLGILIKVGSKRNVAYDKIILELDELQHTDSEGVYLLPMKLFALLPSDRTKFFRYEGSLTTPPCSEAVIWTVFKEPVEISEEEMEHFRNDLFATDASDAGINPNKTLIDNFRPVQPLNGRTIHVSYDIETSSAVILLPASLALILTILASTFFSS